jgi:hypothetical protein
MGNILGNIIGGVLILITALFGIVSLMTSAIAFLAIAYGSWLLVLGSNMAMRPNERSMGRLLFSPEEFKAYRKYHMHIRFPGAAEAYSAVLNAFRIAGIVWAVLCFWNGLYWYGALATLYFFVSGGLILSLSPLRYMLGPAQKGNDIAEAQLQLIESVREKYEIIAKQT